MSITLKSPNLPKSHETIKMLDEKKIAKPRFITNKNQWQKMMQGLCNKTEHVEPPVFFGPSYWA